MPKISINILAWNSPRESVRQCLAAALNQDFEDYEVVFSDNGSTNGILDFVSRDFAGEKKLRVVDNHSNLGYTGGHNRFFSQTGSEFLMVLNPDAKLDNSFLKNIIKVFDDPLVGCATGKMLKTYKSKNGFSILDGTGIVLSRARRGRERGQLEEDRGQYDHNFEIFGVSGAASVYRKTALEKVKLFKDEYFDTDFFAYWEDLDISWRMRLAGFKARFVPDALVYHDRHAGSTEKGYKDVRAFVSHHKKFSTDLVRWNWRNHLFAIIKNDFGWPLLRDLPLIIFREAAMIGYILIFERRILGAVPVFFKLLPKMLQKRKIIQSARKVRSSEAVKWFGTNPK